MEKIILASQSPRRKQLLEWAEVPFEVRVSNADESFPRGMAPEAVAVHIAVKKAEVVANQLATEMLVLAADTIVVLGDQIIGKPTSEEEAFSIIKSLSGKTHRVITGVCLTKNNQSIQFSDITEVDFHPLSDEQIRFYVQKYKPFDKAGAYAIQEWVGVVGIRSIRGDFYNVMGLPVSRVVQAIRDWQHQ